MKPKIIIYFIIILSWTSCATRYQIHQIKSEQVQEIETDIYLYKGKDIAITYDFWAEGGAMLFEIYNERDSTIYFDLKESRLTVNSLIYSYVERPSAMNERPSNSPQATRLIIPPKESQTVEGFPVSYDWQKIPRKQQSLIFGESDSPLIFKNKLVYSFDATLKAKKTIENTFWVTEISELKKREFKDYAAVELSKADKFYVSKYNNGDNTFFWLDLVVSILEVVVFF